MKIGDDHDRKLEPFRLMNRHQPHDIRRFIHLAFALASANRLELFDVTDEIAYQMARLLKLLGQPKQLFDIGHALRTVKICRNDGQKLG